MILKNKHLRLFLLPFCAVFGLLVGSGQTSALSYQKNTDQKAAAYTIYRCYSRNGSDGNPIMKDQITLDEFKDISSLMNSYDNVTYQKTSNRKAATVAANNLLTLRYEDVVQDSQFTDDEKYQLYTDYLRDVYGISIANGTLVCGSQPSGDGWMQMPYLRNGSFQTCYAKPLFDNGTTVPGLNSLNYYDGSARTWQQLVSALQASQANNTLTSDGVKNVQRILLQRRHRGYELDFVPSYEQYDSHGYGAGGSH